MKPLRKSPTNSASPVMSFITRSSRAPTKKKIWTTPKGGDLAESGEAGRDVGERGAIEVDVTAEADARGGGDVAEHSKHRDAAVLELNLTQTVEAVLVSILEETERIPEAPM